MKDVVYVLLSCIEDGIVGCEVFRTRQALLDCIKSEMRRWRNYRLGDVDVAIAQMERSMNENGYWVAGNGLKFVLRVRELLG